MSITNLFLCILLHLEQTLDCFGLKAISVIIQSLLFHLITDDCLALKDENTAKSGLSQCEISESLYAITSNFPSLKLLLFFTLTARILY